MREDREANEAYDQHTMPYREKDREVFRSKPKPRGLWGLKISPNDNEDEMDNEVEEGIKNGDKNER